MSVFRCARRGFGGVPSSVVSYQCNVGARWGIAEKYSVFYYNLQVKGTQLWQVFSISTQPDTCRCPINLLASRRIQGPLPFDTAPNCLRTHLRTVFGGELNMASSLYFILPALGGYTLTSLYLLKNPQILHKKKRAAFHCTHISHRGGKEGTVEGCSS